MIGLAREGLPETRVVEAGEPLGRGPRHETHERPLPRHQIHDADGAAAPDALHEALQHAVEDARRIPQLHEGAQQLVLAVHRVDLRAQAQRQRGPLALQVRGLHGVADRQEKLRAPLLGEQRVVLLEVVEDLAAPEDLHELFVRGLAREQDARQHARALVRLDAADELVARSPRHLLVGDQRVEGIVREAFDRLGRAVDGHDREFRAQKSADLLVIVFAVVDDQHPSRPIQHLCLTRRPFSADPRVGHH
jgi:hypothetical protein